MAVLRVKRAGEVRVEVSGNVEGVVREHLQRLLSSGIAAGREKGLTSSVVSSVKRYLWWASSRSTCFISDRRPSAVSASWLPGSWFVSCSRACENERPEVAGPLRAKSPRAASRSLRSRKFLCSPLGVVRALLRTKRLAPALIGVVRDRPPVSRGWMPYRLAHSEGFLTSSAGRSAGRSFR